ncbi:hypothetical protein [Tenacibaculum finnmarkense]|uniref:hypothetical protein n=1 Tax=Tenacibaculum finnmarkense TaxID=2781243 RepID=UPI00187B7315|nr:hypothetical protein [Tenacibaculum finnmarkense]MBE7649166.1 hypothetical protein [Tenacibaculum finnmarkense genomovar ulcerans]
MLIFDLQLNMHGMILFLNLTNQINDEQFSFSFYNTCTNKIESFADEQVFDSKKDFIEAYDIAVKEKKNAHHPINRYLDLIITDLNKENVSVGLDYKNCFHEVKEGEAIYKGDINLDDLN